MRRVTIYFIVIAILISAIVHLFLLNAAVEFSVKLRLFEAPAAEDLFHIKTVERPRPNLGQMSALREDESVSLEDPTTDAGHTAGDVEDRRRMLAQRGLISFDASEAEINEALKKLKVFEGETLELDPRVRPDEDAASIAQEIVAIEETITGEHINPPTRTVIRPGKTGWATEDVAVTDEGASAGDVLEAINRMREGGGNDGTGGRTDGFGPRADTMLEDSGVIPTIIKPPDDSTSPIEIEAAELEDVVGEPAELLRKYAPLDDLLDVTMYTYHAPDEADGYFEVVIQPRRDRSEFTVIPKDIIFVVDTSSSVRQPKLDRYIEGLQRCVEALNPKDRFDVVEFKTEPNRMADRLVPVTKTRLRTADYFLGSLESGGNTDVYSAVQGLVGVRPEAQRPYMVFLVTDGRANRGVVENRNIINQVAEINKNQAAIYSFAGGSKFNEYLLDLLSYRNKGESRFERRERDVPDALFDFYQEVRDPILLNLRTQVGTVDSADVYPKVLPDFFLKSRITICGRYGDEHEFSMQILGEVGGETKEFIFKQSFDRPDNGDARVARQWAFHKIYHLIGQMVEHGEDDATVAEIRALGKKHGIQTPYYE